MRLFGDSRRADFHKVQSTNDLSLNFPEGLMKNQIPIPSLRPGGWDQSPGIPTRESIILHYKATGPQFHCASVKLLGPREVEAGK